MLRSLLACFLVVGCGSSGIKPDEPPSAMATMTGHIDELTQSQILGWLDANKRFGAKPISLAINSPGGEIDAALEIGVAIARYPGTVTCATSRAASAAAFVFEFCQRRYITEHGYLLFHEAAFFVEGTHTYRVPQLDRMKAGLQAANALIAAIIARRLEMDVDDYYEHIDDKEWILRGSEAVDANAADAVIAEHGRYGV